MTDRRTRVLVIAAIIFALAVGVLLGSGPLRSAATGSTDATAAELRNQRDAALADAGAARSRAQAGQDFADAASAPLLAGRLAGRVIAVIRAADATDADAAAVSARLVDAGAAVGATVGLTADWTADDRAPFRDALAEQITSSLDNPPTGATSAEILGAALVQALSPVVASANDLAGSAASDRAETLWTLLTVGGLVTGERNASADAYLLLSAGDDVTVVTSAARGFGMGVVGAFTGPVAGAAADASTVTDAASFYGSFAVVGALIESVAGGSGAYDAADAPSLIAKSAQ